MTKQFESSAKKKMNLILRFLSAIMTEIADSNSPTLVRLPTSHTLKPQIAKKKLITQRLLIANNTVSRVSERSKTLLVVIFDLMIW
jgi:hypothetical protein